MRMPATHYAGFDERDGTFLLMLEDLADTGCEVSDGTWGISPDSAAAALEDLAELHVRFEDATVRQAEAGWVTQRKPGNTYGTTLLQFGLDHHRDRLSDEFAALAHLYIDHDVALSHLWLDGPTTVIHGDPHIGNLFIDSGRTGFLDWGLITLSTPLRDVSYFINMAMSIEDRRAHEVDLLRHYLDVKDASKTTQPFTFDDAWETHRIHAAYTVPACCQIVTFPDDATARRRTFASAFLARAEAAISDLEARKAVAAAGIT
jgi:aminoglycoside phosphotransferase (APT) family kinase protein